MNARLSAAAAVVSMIWAAPAAALTLEEFFLGPVVSVGAVGGEVGYDEDFDELLVVDDGSDPSFSIGATIGGVLVPPVNDAGFAGASLGAFLGIDFAFGDPVDLRISDDLIEILFETTQDDSDLVDEYMALVANFDSGTFTVATFADELGLSFGGGFRSASLELLTGAGPTPPQNGVIPLPAPLALLGLGVFALGMAARRRAS